MRHLCFASAILLISIVTPTMANDFFVIENVFKNDTECNTVQSQAKILKELGYDGLGPSHCTDAKEKLEALQGQGLKLTALYCHFIVEKDTIQHEPQLEATLPMLGKHESLLWLNIRRGKTCPSGTERDDAIVKLIQRFADKEKPNGLKIALYPHANFYVATVDDAIRIVKKVNRKNVGLTFNLCHHLHEGNSKNVESYLAKIRPMLFCVTICGADNVESKNAGWSRLIQPLGEGTFDVNRVLGTLKRLDYQGPIGLQCYGLPGTAREKLTQGINGWKKLQTMTASKP